MRGKANFSGYATLLLEEQSQCLWIYIMLTLTFGKLLLLLVYSSWTYPHVCTWTTSADVHFVAFFRVFTCSGTLLTLHVYGQLW